jgi:hypothetical protein
LTPASAANNAISGARDMTGQSFHFPDKSSWRFDAILASEPCRASIERDIPPEMLVGNVRDALEEALRLNNVRFALDYAEQQPNDCRAVVQFAIGAALFDRFFNGRTGYRAHFRVHYECGLEFNSQLIEALRDILRKWLPDRIIGRNLDYRFRDVGEARIDKAFLIASLVPDLSKVWFCTKRIQSHGGIEDLATGLVGPRILLDGNSSWAAPYREDETAWLDIKGAFVGATGVYQVKPPIERAKRLQSTGEA